MADLLTYSTLAAGSGKWGWISSGTTLTTNGTFIRVGRSTGPIPYEAFFEVDLSAIPAGTPIRGGYFHFDGATNGATAAFDMQIRRYDWGAAPDLGDWRTVEQAAACPLVAVLNSSAYSTAGMPFPITNPENLIAGQVNRFVIVDSEWLAGTPFTANEYINLTAPGNAMAGVTVWFEIDDPADPWVEVPITTHTQQNGGGSSSTVEVRWQPFAFDPGDYAGDSVEVFWEACITPMHIGNQQTWEVRNFADDSVCAALSLAPKIGRRMHRVRFTPAAGRNLYYLAIPSSGSVNGNQVTISRLIVRVVKPTKIRCSVPLINMDSAYSWYSQTAFGIENAGTWRRLVAPLSSRWVKDSAAWHDLAGAQPWTFEAVLYGSAQACLYNETDGAPVAATVLTADGTANVQLLSASFADDAAGFDDGDVFALRATAGSQVYDARLFVTLDRPKDFELIHRISRAYPVNTTADKTRDKNWRARPRWAGILASADTVSLLHEAVGLCADDAPVWYAVDCGASRATATDPAVDDEKAGINWASGVRSNKRVALTGISEGDSFHGTRHTSTANQEISDASIVVKVNGFRLGPEWSNLSLAINGGAAATDDNDVTLTLHADADGSPPDQVALSDDGEEWGAWQSYGTSKSYQLTPQTSYPSQTKTVYAKFREQRDGEWYESAAVSDSISLAVSWTGSVVIVNRDAEQTYERVVSVRFKGTSTAQGGAGHGDDVVARYRIRDDAGAWSAWQTASPAGDGWTTVPFTLEGTGTRTVEVQWEDDDGNQWLAADAIAVLPAGVLIDNAPPPMDITNWRLLIGGRDFIDDCDGPPSFTRGEHGPGSLSASIPVENPLHPYANELVAGAVVELWDGLLELWDGVLKPLAPTSSDAPELTINAAGALDACKQDEGVRYSAVDADPSHWHVSAKASKAFGCDTEDGPSIMHSKGRGVSGGKGAGVWYWSNDGIRPQIIDHVYFGDSDIDVGGSGWYGRLQVAASPWSSWTTAKEWHNEAGSGAFRVPASGSFAENGYAGVYALKAFLVSTADLTAAESVNDRWLTLNRPEVFFIGALPRVDEIHAAIAGELGYPVESAETGEPFTSAAWRDDATTWAAILEDSADRATEEVEWRWSDGTYHVRPKPTAPENRHRWYVVDSRECDWGVVADEESRSDYVEVLYQIAGDATYPNGTVRSLTRPAEPTETFPRLTTLDLTEDGPMTAAEAADAGDQWLAWSNAQAKAGPVSGFGGWLRTIDGQWVAACHAREGDWIQARDLLELTPAGTYAPVPVYITGVEVPSPDDVTIHTGGSERDFRLAADVLPYHDDRAYRRRRKRKKKKKRRRR